MIKGSRLYRTTIVCLKVRVIILAFLLAAGIAYLHYNYHYFTNKWIARQSMYSLFEAEIKFPLFSRILTNLQFLKDGYFFLFTRTIVSSLLLLVIGSLVLFLLAGILNRKKKDERKILKAVSGALFLIVLAYAAFYLKVNAIAAVFAAGAVIFVFRIDMRAFDLIRKDPEELDGRVGVLLVMGVPYVQDILIAPFICAASGLLCRVRNKKTRVVLAGIMSGAHFLLMVFLLFLLLTPHNTGMNNIFRAKTYGMAIDDSASRMFFFDAGTQSVLWLDLASGVVAPVKVYSGRKLGEFIAADSRRNELYFIDRRGFTFNTVDTITLKLKSKVWDSYFDMCGDSRITSDGRYVYVISDNPLLIYKIDPDAGTMVKKAQCCINTNHVGYNPVKKVLYSNNYFFDPRDKSGEIGHFLYEIDPETLRISAKAAIPGGCWGIAVSADGRKIYCAAPFDSLLRSSIYVVDAYSLDIVDRVKAPLGVRNVVLDEERGFLFAGSGSTNIVLKKDLKTGKILETYKMGNRHIREIVLDKDRRKIYVSSGDSGVYCSDY